MKKSIKKLTFFLTILVFSCQQEDSGLSKLQGTVRFGGISLEFAPMGSPGSRVTGVSPWVHIYPNSADLVFTNKSTGQEYVLEYNPNDFSTAYTILLPFGPYDFYSIVEGDVFSDFLPFEASGEFILDNQSLEISLQGKTDYGLITVKDQYLEKATVSNGNNESELILCDKKTHRYKYVKGGTITTLKIIESTKGSTLSRELNIVANKHYNFVLKLGEGSAVITGLTMDSFELEEEDIIIGSSSKFFEENGTIKCPQASPGDKGEVNGKVYEAVDRALLIQRRNEGASLSCVCTSLVTDMSAMFSNSEFNQNISSWDVSNVTNMADMFRFAEDFNQPIGNWDVSNVTNMADMFHFADDFNQPIEDWDVSNVTNMRQMFLDAYDFNQPIGDWDVINVTSMEKMFRYAERFNQDIGDWDVSNVKNMGDMFSNAWAFNKEIGNWNVENVTNMNNMFGEASSFNQNLTKWCVQNIPTEPGGFSIDSPLIQANKPIWGTCPD